MDNERPKDEENEPSHSIFLRDVLAGKSQPPCDDDLHRNIEMV